MIIKMGLKFKNMDFNTLYVNLNTFSGEKKRNKDFF